ncbi:hypothetical protein DFJ74DRAFT_700838 [Hyaloraphidium curvatum]|nr:hypothetical protein DFJ74DRAFT_700838 [Hyaloraphidium curvatum]
MKSCAHGGLFLKIRRAGITATCLGSTYGSDGVATPSNCSVYTDASCTALAGCSPKPVEQRLGARAYSEAAGGIVCNRTDPASLPEWCGPAEDMVVHGAAGPSACPPAAGTAQPVFGHATCVQSCTDGGLYMRVRRVGALAGCVGSFASKGYRDDNDPANCTLYEYSRCTNVSAFSVAPTALECPTNVDWSLGNPLGDDPTQGLLCNRTGAWFAWCGTAEAVALRNATPPTSCTSTSVGIPPGVALDEPMYIAARGEEGTLISFACDAFGCYLTYDTAPWQRVCPLSADGNCTWTTELSYLRAVNSSDCLFRTPGTTLRNQPGINEGATEHLPTFNESATNPGLVANPLPIASVRISYGDRSLECFERNAMLSSRTPETPWTMYCPPHLGPECQAVYLETGLCLTAPNISSRWPRLEACPWRRGNGRALWTRPESGGGARLRSEASGLCAARSGGSGRDSFGVNRTVLEMKPCDSDVTALDSEVRELDAAADAGSAPAASNAGAVAIGVDLAAAVVATAAI